MKTVVSEHTSINQPNFSQVKNGDVNHKEVS